jgi:MFS family permease
MRVGIRANLAQFCLLVGVNALIGGVLGQERTVLPLLARDVFGVEGFTTLLSFVLAFGLVKAGANLVAGLLSDRIGRRPVLIAGWIAGLPVPLLLMWAPSWSWIVVANVLLGINQGLGWSTTVIMKIDLAGPARRGLAMGLNEAAGYGAVAVAAAATGFIAARAGLRPAPFFLGLAFAGLGFALTLLFVRETLPYAGAQAAAEDRAPARPLRDVFLTTSFRDRAMSSCSQAGLVNNLNDGMAWGLLPIWFARGGLSIASIGLLAALYPAVWGLGQIVTGGLSDRIGRKGLITIGMLVQAAGLGLIASTETFGWWAAGAVTLGVGTAMVYPTLLAAISDVAPAASRASSVGVYRMWRDLGFVLGAIVAGVIADAFGLAAAIWSVAAITAASGVLVLVRMYETLPQDRRNHGGGPRRLGAPPVNAGAERV